jgi:hypothetical protein
MRINGFEQIKSFYSWVFNNQDKRITPQHISLYNFLINQNNRNNWVEWFKCPFDLGMAGSCIGNKKTYYKCLSDLMEWRLIKYEKGTNNWKAPLIKIEVLNCTSSDTATVPSSEPQHIPLPIPLPTHIYKLITNNLKLITDNFDLIESNLSIWINKEKEESNKFDFKNSLLSLGIEKQIVSDWLKVRAKKKAINSETAYKSIIKQIELSGLTANECIKKAVEKSWQGFEASWLTKKQDNFSIDHTKTDYTNVGFSERK